MILAILNALAALPSLFGYIQSFCAQCALWYVQSCNNSVLAAVADAAAASARANNKEERDAALDLWRTAMSKPRVS